MTSLREATSSNHAHPTDREQERAIAQVNAAFPFPESLAVPFDSTPTIVRAVCAAVAPPARIIDFGAGTGRTAAVLSTLGYRCTAIDDLRDDWVDARAHADILEFASRHGVRFTVGDSIDLVPGEFDVAILADVIEHFHSSPRRLLTEIVGRLRSGGVLVISVPSAVNVRKRFDVLRGRTNYGDFDYFYWYPEPWRGHVREYVRADLVRLGEFLHLEAKITGCHNMIEKVPKWIRPIYRTLVAPFPTLKDSLLFVGIKPASWTQVQKTPDFDDVKRSAGHYVRYGNQANDQA